jgi:hypothetical protein
MKLSPNQAPVPAPTSETTHHFVPQKCIQSVDEAMQACIDQAPNGSVLVFDAFAAYTGFLRKTNEASCDEKSPADSISTPALSKASKGMNVFHGPRNTFFGCISPPAWLTS